jgi:hypothetical protein
MRQTTIQGLFLAAFEKRTGFDSTGEFFTGMRLPEIMEALCQNKK